MRTGLIISPIPPLYLYLYAIVLQNVLTCLDIFPLTSSGQVLYRLGHMSNETKRFMRKFRRKLDHYVGMEITHCGHEEPMGKAFDYGWKLKKWVESEFERLAILARGAP